MIGSTGTQTRGIKTINTVKFHKDLFNALWIALKKKEYTIIQGEQEGIRQAGGTILAAKQATQHRKCHTSNFERMLFIFLVSDSCFISFPAKRFSQRSPPEHGMVKNRNYWRNISKPTSNVLHQAGGKIWKRHPSNADYWAAYVLTGICRLRSLKTMRIRNISVLLCSIYLEKSMPLHKNTFLFFKVASVV